MKHSEWHPYEEWEMDDPVIIDQVKKLIKELKNGDKKMKRKTIKIKLLDMDDETYEELCELIKDQIGEYEELNFIKNYFETEIEYK